MKLPPEALLGLRAAVLAAPDGEQRLRDAGFVAGLAIFDDFAESIRAADECEPDALPFPRFADALGSYLAGQGWGHAALEADAAGLVRLRAADWVEAQTDGASPYPVCHFSTGLLAGLFGRVAGAPLAVLELRCRSTGDTVCEFAVGSREVMDALWERMRA